MHRQLIAYIATFLAAASVSGLLYRALDRGYASLGCYQQPAPADRFLAYCASPQFGDYEHAAYYYDLEPEAVAHLKTADVVFFGNSRAQMALSTQALLRFFASHAMTPYLLGFGYAEMGAFPLAIVRRYGLKPKAIVILADPFFVDVATGPVQAASSNWVHRWWIIPELQEYIQKRMFITLGSGFCSAWPSLCVQTQSRIYRSRLDGSWQWQNYPLDQSMPINGSRSVLTAGMAELVVAFAERFIAATGVARQCVVLSAAPNSLIDASDYVDELGRRLGTRVSLPKLAGLGTADGNHLAPASAERWSAALLEDIGPLLTGCVGG